MVSQTLIEELKQQKIWLIYFKTITKNGNTTKSPRSAKNTATGANKAHADTLATYDEAVPAMKLYEANSGHFWNAMRGHNEHYDKLHGGYDNYTSTYNFHLSLFISLPYMRKGGGGSTLKVYVKIIIPPTP